MPPYAAHQDPVDLARTLTEDYHLVEQSVAKQQQQPLALTDTEPSFDEDDEEPTGIEWGLNPLEKPCFSEDDPAYSNKTLEKVFGFNPCALKPHNPAHAFKKRICSESGEEVHKYKHGGYTKEEIVDPETLDVTKRYYSPHGQKLREYRALHKEAGFCSVMTELLEHFVQLKLQALQEAEREAALLEEAERVAKAKAEAEAAAAVENAKFKNKAKKAMKKAWKKTTRLGKKKKKSKKVAESNTSNWRETVDPNSGKTYYWNKETRATTWTKPAEF